MTTERAARWRPVVAVATAICIGVAVALFFWRPLVALGFVAGVITGAGMLSALVVVLRRVAAPPDERTDHPAPWVVLHFLKFGAAAALAYLVIGVLSGDAFAFAGGYTVALVVLLIIMVREPTISTVLANAAEESTKDTETNSRTE